MGMDMRTYVPVPYHKVQSSEYEHRVGMTWLLDVCKVLARVSTLETTYWFGPRWSWFNVYRTA
jgi:hypothetical protein